MPTAEKTALELAELIREAIGNKSEVRLAVFSNPLGWHAKVYGAGPDTLKMQERVDRVVATLKRHYKLAQER